MKVMLIGYGKMGKTIEGILNERGHEVTFIVDKTTETNIEDAKGAVDVAIEFTEPSVAFDNVKKCIENQIPVICGTTGWLDRLNEVEVLCEKFQSGFFYASNFSLGVNIFFELNKQLAKLMNQQEDYQVSMSEIHHTEKKDAPSGTAITLAEGLAENLDAINAWALKGEASQNDQIEIEALREPHVPGTHEVSYVSEIDRIDIKHTAYSRKGFALGAVIASEWLKKQVGVFTMHHMLKF